MVVDGVKMNLCLFRAEDGIRDAQESRGLGDVYKRQDGNSSLLPPLNDAREELVLINVTRHGYRFFFPSVSYTHLTLPTIFSV